MKILLVEDDPKIASFVKKGLQEAGFIVDATEDGEQAFALVEKFTYDLAIIDIMLPGLNGLRLIDLIRQNGMEIAILVLSAKHTVNDRIKGLQQGADDYMVKPFVFAELLARVQALIRRSSKNIEVNRISCGDLMVDLLERKVYRNDRLIELQPKEYALLEYLIRNKGRTLSKTMIMEQVWDFHFDPQTNVVDVLVCRLRNKIDKSYSPKLIHTIHGIGYVLQAMDSQVQ